MRLHVHDLGILKLISNGPRSHLSLSRQHQALIGQLWVRRLVRLQPGDIWNITETGIAVLDCGGTVH